MTRLELLAKIHDYDAAIERNLPVSLDTETMPALATYSLLTGTERAIARWMLRHGKPASMTLLASRNAYTRKFIDDCRKVVSDLSPE